MIAWIRRTSLYPLAQDRTLVVSELVLGGHLQIAILVTHSTQQQATFHITRHNRRTGVAAGRQSLTAVQQQTTLLFLSLDGVALVTMLVQ